MTPTERNARIAREVLGWERVQEPILSGLWWNTDSEQQSLPNFVSDDSTMGMLVEGSIKKFGAIEMFENDAGGCRVQIGLDGNAPWFDADTSHAALIAAIENWIEEGE